jgi:uncharacterized membrane protein
MGARVRSLWQKIRKPLLGVVAFVVSMLMIALIVGIIGGYVFNWNWTGLSQKTLWDWMQLLFIPVVLAIAGFWFNHRERKAAEFRAENERNAAELRAITERDIADDNQHEKVLQEYIDKMSELLLHEDLRGSDPEKEMRKIARVRTLTVLPRLDGQRKRNVIQFLYESGLIDKDKRIIDLGGADLSEAVRREVA